MQPAEVQIGIEPRLLPDMIPADEADTENTQEVSGVGTIRPLGGRAEKEMVNLA